MIIEQRHFITIFKGFKIALFNFMKRA